MSLHHVEEFSCPKCDTKQEYSYWESINVTLEPELRDELLAYRINVIKCKNCDFQAFLTIPLLYHDMTKSFCVQYYPEKYLTEPKQFESNLSGITRDGKTKLSKDDSAFAKMGYLLEPHIVFDMNEMIRYVVFREYLWQFWEQKEKQG
jgi:hypothetical protein